MLELFYRFHGMIIPDAGTKSIIVTKSPYVHFKYVDF